MIVFGNGESRKSLKIDSISEEKIGCNAICRDFRMDHLVCVDKRMLKEVVERKYNRHCQIYTRQEHFVTHRLEANIRMLPTLPYQGESRFDKAHHWGSGPYAVLLAANLTKLKEVKLIGFDLYSQDGKQNNVYKNTKNYLDDSKNATDPRHWIYQIGKVFECFPDVKFIVYNRDDWQLPDEWKKSNVVVDKISNIV